jgi:NADH-quinone oxidoreductase subunit E
MDTVSTTDFKTALQQLKDEEGSLIPLLQAAQNEFSYVPEWTIHEISEATGIALSEIFGVVTFYKQFKLSPPGRNIIRVCDGTACHVNGSNAIIKTLGDILGIGIDETTSDRVFTLQSVACLGCCSLAPVMMINDETYGRLTPGMIREIVDNYRTKVF